MKTLNLFLAGLAASLAIFAACDKQENPVSTEIPATPEATETTEGGFRTLTAIAAETKTTVDNKHVLWTNGDVIGLYCGIPEGLDETTTSATFTTSTSSPSATAEFTKSDENVPVKIGDYYFAAYPNSGISRWYYSGSGNEYRLYFAFAKEQIAVKGSWDSRHGAMAAKSTDNSFSFQHCSAFIKFTVGASSPAFKSVKVTANGGETNIVDRIKVVISGNNLMQYGVATYSSMRSPYVTLSTPDGNAFEEGTYYISILPIEYPEGFTIMFENTAGAIATKTISGDFTFNGGDVANIGTVGTMNFVVPTTPLEVGTVYKEGNVNQGVVFYVDPTNPYKGKIVSVSTSEQIKWADAAYTDLGGTDTSNGIANYNKVTGFASYVENPEHFPAMKYCADLRTTLGGNWYLPVAGELQTLFKAYYGLNDNVTLTSGVNYRFDGDNLIDMTPKRNFDAALKLMGETTTATLDGDADYDGTSDNNGYGTANGVQYWSSKVNSNNGNVQFVRFGVYQLSNGTKTTAKYVRCVREVQIQ